MERLPSMQYMNLSVNPQTTMLTYCLTLEVARDNEFPFFCSSVGLGLCQAGQDHKKETSIRAS